jgi:mRNA interferase RelE/StbE
MWKVEYKRKFLKEFASLPQNVQSRVEIIVFKELEADNPFELGYINKMKGYKDKYKIKIGDYRIGLTINQKQKIIICERVAHRQEIYQIFP